MLILGVAVSSCGKTGAPPANRENLHHSSGPRAVQGDIEEERKLLEQECPTDAGCGTALAEVLQKASTLPASQRPLLTDVFVRGAVIGRFEAAWSRERDRSEFNIYGCSKTSVLLSTELECNSLRNSSLPASTGPKGDLYHRAEHVLNLSPSDPATQLYWYAFDGGYAWTWNRDFEVDDRLQRTARDIKDGCDWAIARTRLTRGITADEEALAVRNCDQATRIFLERERESLLH